MNSVEFVVGLYYPVECSDDRIEGDDERDDYGDEDVVDSVVVQQVDGRNGRWLRQRGERRVELS